MVGAAQHDDEPAVMSAEAKALQLKESTEQCQAVLQARRQMQAEDAQQVEGLANMLRPSFLCNACKNLLLEPWTVKDCGHLYCFRCLHSLVYEQQATKCVACAVASGDKWNQDSFGAFKVVVDANKNRKVARDGGRFLYDDSVDTIVRMLWPDRVADYAQVDVDREQRRLEDVAARSHFEIQVHGDRLVNPSSANPGMAAGRATGRADRRRAGTRLRCPPLRLELPVELAGAGEAGDGAASHHMGTVLVMPMQNAVSEDMRAWAARSGALARDRWLPALLKPYLRLPLDRMTVRDLKTILARLLNMHEFWHDSLHAYERAEGIEAHQLALHLEWSQARPQTPNWLLTEEVPDDAEVQPFLQEGQGACSLLAFSLFLERHGVLIEQGLDLIYSVRPHVA